jgi:hypothetical protein
VGCGQNGVHATTRGDNGNVGAGATNIGDNNVLVFGGLVGVLCIMGEEGSDGLDDELEDLKTGIGGGLVKGFLLGVGKVGGNGDDGSVDLFANVVRGGLCETAEVTSGDFCDCAGVLLVGFSVLDLESDRVVGIDGVGRCVAVGGIY